MDRTYTTLSLASLIRVLALDIAYSSISIHLTHTPVSPVTYRRVVHYSFLSYIPFHSIDKTRTGVSSSLSPSVFGSSLCFFIVCLTFVVLDVSMSSLSLLDIPRLVSSRLVSPLYSSALSRSSSEHLSHHAILSPCVIIYALEYPYLVSCPSSVRSFLHALCLVVCFNRTRLYLGLRLACTDLFWWFAIRCDLLSLLVLVGVRVLGASKRGVLAWDCWG